MTSIPNPDSWMDVLTILLVALFAAIPTWVSVKNHKRLGEVQGQVSNGNTTPLRQDLDSMRETLNEIRSDIRDIRTDLRAEHRDRLDLEGRFEDFKRSQ